MLSERKASVIPAEAEDDFPDLGSSTAPALQHITKGRAQGPKRDRRRPARTKPDGAQATDDLSSNALFSDVSTSQFGLSESDISALSVEPGNEEEGTPQQLKK